jgi:hypothetical protein
MHDKKSTFGTVLAVMAALLVIGSAVLFWVAWKGVQLLRREAAHAGTVMLGDAGALAGKSDYVGTWEGGDVKMTIEPTGHVDWAMKSAHESEELHGSVGFDGGNLVVDAFVIKKKFHIDKPPHVDGTRTVMTLDGTELERK